MKICQEHWDSLKLGLKESNLERFVLKNSKEAKDNLINQLENKNFTPDPLIMCNNMLWARGISTFGLKIMENNICPCCYANENYPNREGEPTGDFWIRTLIPHIKKMFEDKGLSNTN